MNVGRVALTKELIERTRAEGGREVWLWDHLVTGLGIRVLPASTRRPQGRKSFVIQYRAYEPRQIRLVTRRMVLGEFPTLTLSKARTRAKQHLAEAQQGRDPSADRRAEREAPTVAEFAERYLTQHARPKKKAKSVAQDDAMIERFIKPRLGALKIHAVSRADVVDFHHSLRGTPYQANRVLALLSKMMNLAEAWGLRPPGSNPCRHVEKFPEKPRERFLSEAEMAALAATLADGERAGRLSPSVVAAVRLLLLTGARLSEILALRWSEVDEECQCLRLSDGKTGKRLVYLAAPALEVLHGIARVDGNPYVLPGAKPGAHLVNLEKAWLKIRARASMWLWANDARSEVAGIVQSLRAELDREPTVSECQAAAAAKGVDLPPGLMDMHLHDLRHSFASTAAAGGLSLPMIGALLGHTQYQTTKRYTHLVGDPLRQAANLVGQRIAGAMRRHAPRPAAVEQRGAAEREAGTNAIVPLDAYRRSIVP